MKIIEKLTVKKGWEWSVWDLSEPITRADLNTFADAIIDVVDGDEVIQYRLSNLPSKHAYMPLEAFLNEPFMDEVAVETEVRSIARIGALSYNSIFSEGMNIRRAVFRKYPSSPVNKEFSTELEVYREETSIKDKVLYLLGEEKQRYESQLTDFLYTVNGDVFIPRVGEGKTYLPNAAFYISEVGQTKVSVIDFNPLGGLMKDECTVDDVAVLETTLGHSLLEIDLKNYRPDYTPFLVIRGTLYLLDGRYWITRSNKLRVRIDHRQVIRQYRRRPDEKLTWIESNEHGNVFQLTTFDALAYYRDLNTGVFYIKNSEIAKREDVFHRTEIPYHFTFPRAPKGIAFYEGGLVCEYRVNKKKDNVVSLVTLPNRITREVQDTVPRPEAVFELAGEDYWNHQTTLVRLLDVYTLNI